MKKLLTSILTITSTFGVFAPIFYSTSCSSEEQHTQQENFIKDRTFSILGLTRSQRGLDYCFGTIWIIDDATPDIDNDYQYYVATNWHVTHGMDIISEYGKITYKYADDSLLNSSKGYIPSGSYITFKSYEIVGNEDTDYSYKNTYTEKDYWKPGIDFHICKVDFANETFMTSKIKEKFARLDQYKKEHNNHINTFVNSDEVLNKTKYVGGYPAEGVGFGSEIGSVWEFHKISSDDLDFGLSNEVIDAGLDHAIGDPAMVYDEEGNPIPNPDPTSIREQWYWYDVSAMLMYNKNQPDNWMAGGSSGSMLITEDFEVCGIYWGGWNDINHKYHPCFSCFKTTERDFIDEILNKKI